MKIIITSDSPQDGKSTAGQYLENKLGIKHCPSSDSIVRRLASLTGWTFEEIKENRKKDPSAHRPALIKLGQEMVASKQYPGIICFNEGFGIVDGIRIKEEIKAIHEFMKDEDFIHIHLYGRSDEIDSTNREVVSSYAHAKIANTGTLEDLYRELDKVVSV